MRAPPSSDAASTWRAGIDAGSGNIAADVCGATGFGHEIDRGPGRHGLSNALFLYVRDPDQHRIGLFTTHYQFEEYLSLH